MFKGEIGESLDDFIYQVEEFAVFHAWDPVETCRQARTLFAGCCIGLHSTYSHTPERLDGIEGFVNPQVPTPRFDCGI